MAESDKTAVVRDLDELLLMQPLNLRRPIRLTTLPLFPEQDKQDERDPEDDHRD